MVKYSSILRRDDNINVPIIKPTFSISQIPAYLNIVPKVSTLPFENISMVLHQSINLMDFIECLEKEIGYEAIKNFEEMQPGDVKTTSADTASIEQYINFKPNTKLNKGIHKFYDWYKSYYLIKK